jgi:hypothetical protein
MIQCLSTPGFGLTEKISALTLKPGIILVELRKLDPSCRSMAFEKMAVTIERYRQKPSLSLTRPQLAVGLFLSLLALAQTRVQEGSIERRPTIGVAFEGGRALGLGHVGVLEWLEQNHIPVDYIAGTNMGGLACRRKRRVVVKTLFGPLFLAGAYGESGNHKIYFQLGRVF